MDCKKTQELIITDYIDRQMGDKQMWLVEQHLADCHACKEYLNSVKKEAINPFINAVKDVPDGLLWTQIKLGIQENQQHQLEKSLEPGFWERFRSAVYIPRPAFALATFVTMIFVIGSTGQLFFTAPAVKVNGPEQIEYLSYLIDEPAAMNNDSDSQTPIEKYFL